MASEYSYAINADLERTSSAPIPVAKAWSSSYDGACGPLISLTQGVPAIPPDVAFLSHLGRQASDPKNTGYGDLFGESGLREALAKDVSATYGCGNSVRADNIAITAGCNMAAQVVFQTLARAGDEIILACPWYFNHEMCLDMLGIRIVPLQCQLQPGEGMLPNVQDAGQLIGDRTKAIVLVSPNNPTGTIYPDRLLKAFFELCQSHRIALVLDETYRDFLPPSASPSHTLFSLPDWQTTLISLYSFSKSFSIPGHRVGAIVCSEQLLANQIEKVLDTMLICAPVAVQRTLEWAVADEGQKEWRKTRREELVARGQLFRQVINGVNATLVSEGEDAGECQGWTVDSSGAYYAFVRHPYTDRMDSEGVAQLLAQKVGVVVLPATFFGQGVIIDSESGRRVRSGSSKEQHLRFSIANVQDDGIRALEARLVAFDRLLREIPAAIA